MKPRPKKTAPRNIRDIKPPKGYRWVKRTDTPRATDEYFEVRQGDRGLMRMARKIEQPAKPATAAKGKKARARVTVVRLAARWIKKYTWWTPDEVERHAELSSAFQAGYRAGKREKGGSK